MGSIISYTSLTTIRKKDGSNILGVSGRVL